MLIIKPSMPVNKPKPECRLGNMVSLAKSGADMEPIGESDRCPSEWIEWVREVDDDDDDEEGEDGGGEEEEEPIIKWGAEEGKAGKKKTDDGKKKAH